MILVGGFKHEFYFPYDAWDVILPIDELIFFKMVETTNQDNPIYCNHIHLYSFTVSRNLRNIH